MFLKQNGEIPSSIRARPFNFERFQISSLNTFLEIVQKLH